MMPEEIKDAVAQQEEYLRRVKSCAGRPDSDPIIGMSHSFDQFSPRPGVYVRQCWRCRVTESPQDWERLQSTVQVAGR